MQLTPHEIRRIAVAAACDPRTVVRYRAGLAVASTTRVRLDAAIREIERESAERSAPAPTEARRA